MSNNMLFIALVVIALFDICTCVFTMIRFTETQKQIKDISDNQFDAQQVMRIYEQKYARPVLIDRPIIKELRKEYRVPYEVLNTTGNEEELKQQMLERISRDFADVISEYIDYETEEDYVCMEKVIHSRIRVVGNS